MNNTKKIIALAAAAALTLSLAACSGNNSSSTADNSSSDASSTVIRVGASPSPHAEILEFAKEGKTVLINTLEIPEIQKIADYCAVFYEGQIVKILEHQEINEQTVMFYSTNAAKLQEGK